LSFRIIYKHLSEETSTEIEDIDTAFEIWNYLKAYYEESDDEKARKYKKRLEELTYKGENVRTYIVSFENLWKSYYKIMVSLDPIFCKDENSIKLGYLRNSFRRYYPNIYERLTYAVVKEESMSVIKQIIQLSLNEKETVVPFAKRNLEEKKYNNQPYNAQPVFKRKCVLCGSTEHMLYQCDMKDSFYNWKKIEKEKRLKRENHEENFNIETQEESSINNNNDF